MNQFRLMDNNHMEPVYDLLNQVNTLVHLCKHLLYMMGKLLWSVLGQLVHSWNQLNLPLVALSLGRIDSQEVEY